MATQNINSLFVGRYKKSISDLEMEEKPDILYFPPGYITPEEFYHRVFITLHRLKRSAHDAELTVLFNSLDQLASRFPICAREKIFIPGLITTFSAEDITSIFVAVEEPGQPRLCPTKPIQPTQKDRAAD